jgi:hypothetical protein
MLASNEVKDAPALSILGGKFGFSGACCVFIPVLSPFHIFGLVLTFVKGFISS